MRFRRLLRPFFRRRRIDLGRRRRSRRRLWFVILILILIGAVFGLRRACRPEPTLEESPQNYRILVVRYARWANLPEVFVHKVVLAESAGDPQAVSKADAKGLMQILPAAETDVMRKLNQSERGDLFDPEYNLLIGTTYLRMLTDRFDGDAYLVLSAYHMGPTRVARYLAANPGISGKNLVKQFAGPQTQKYCAKILQGEELSLPVTQRPGQPATMSATQPAS